MKGGYAVKDIKTFDKVKAAWDLMATGTKSLSEMATIMNDWGLREIHGKEKFKLRPQTVSRIFTLKFYTGLVTSTKYPDEVRGQHVPMITEQQYYKVRAILEGRNPNKIPLAKRNHESADFPLRRIIKCGYCGTGLTGGWSKGRKTRYAYYRCGTKCTGSSIKVCDLENSLGQLLKMITPRKECLELFLDCVYRSYFERLSRLKKIKDDADEEIRKLQETRRQLVEKNLNGTYSDEVFKEQNTLLEDKMLRAQIAKDDSTIDKYNIEAITSFMKTLLADLNQAYKRSTISQAKVLLGSIFPTGLVWNYKGTLNHEISPLYQSILDIDIRGISKGGLFTKKFEPVLKI